MTPERNIDTAIKKIQDKANAVLELRAKNHALELREEELSTQLSQGIHSEGDSSKLAAKLAPIQTENLIIRTRKAQLEKDLEAELRLFLAVCRQEAAFVQRTGKEFLDKELRGRYPKILALFNEWGIPVEVYTRYQIPTGCNNDSMLWCRNLIEELGDFVNRAEHGRDIDAGDLINTLERCRPWFPEPIAAEETTESK